MSRYIKAQTMIHLQKKTKLYDVFGGWFINDDNDPSYHKRGRKEAKLLSCRLPTKTIVQFIWLIALIQQQYGKKTISVIFHSYDVKFDIALCSTM